MYGVKHNLTDRVIGNLHLLEILANQAYVSSGSLMEGFGMLQ